MTSNVSMRATSASQVAPTMRMNASESSGTSGAVTRYASGGSNRTSSASAASVATATTAITVKMTLTLPERWRRSGGPRHPDHRLEQALDDILVVAALPRMHRRALDDRAARGGQPVKALALRAATDRPCRFSAGADQRNRCEVFRDRVQIDRRVE